MPVPRFYAYTVFRLFIPFVLGILLGNYLFFEGIFLSSLYLFLFIFLFSIVLILHKRYKSYALRWMFGLFTYLLFLLFGVGWMNIRLHHTLCDYPLSETVYRVVITDRPEQKERSILCRAEVLEQRDSCTVRKRDAQKVLLYFPIDSVCGSIRRGDELLLSTHLSSPAPKARSDEFDYSWYLIHKGVSATGFVSSGKWQLIERRVRFSIQDYAADCRDGVLTLYRDLGFRGDHFAILSALTMGYKDELSEAVRESFSVSGASHVLALSGLHVGFLYLLLFFLLEKIPGSSTGMEIFRVGATLLLLWAFAFITGLSPSTVRAVIMFSLLGVSRFSPERTVSLNTLCVAALGMLIYNPSWLFDVGFQLSFVAVASILLIQPWLYEQLTVRSSFADKLWRLSTVSIAAQIGTAPLILFYFSRFSVHFLLTNLLVIPLVTVIVYGAVAMLLFSFLPVVSQVLAHGLKILLGMLTGVVRGIEKLPFASIDQVWVYRLEVLFFYAALLLFGWYVVRRRPRFLLAGLTVLLFLFAYRGYKMEADRPQQSLVFYNVRHCPAVHCVLPNGQSWVAYADSMPDERRLARVASRYWNRLRLLPPVSVSSDYSDPCLIRRNNMLSFAGKRICIVNDDRWKKLQAESSFSVDFVYLCKGYTGRLEWLTQLFDIHHVVLDASIPDYRRNSIREECVRLGIPFTSLSEQSSYFKSPV